MRRCGPRLAQRPPRAAERRRPDRARGRRQAKATKRPWWDSETIASTGPPSCRTTGGRPVTSSCAASTRSASATAEAASRRTSRVGSSPATATAFTTSPSDRSAGGRDARRVRARRHRVDARALDPHLDGERLAAVDDPALRAAVSVRERRQLDDELARREDGLGLRSLPSLVGAFLRSPQRPVQAVARALRGGRPGRTRCARPVESGPLGSGEDPVAPARVQAVEPRLRIGEVDDVVADRHAERPSRYSRSMSTRCWTTWVARWREARRPRSSVRGSTTRSEIVNVSPRAGRFDHVRCASPRA